MGRDHSALRSQGDRGARFERYVGSDGARLFGIGVARRIDPGILMQASFNPHAFDALARGVVQRYSQTHRIAARVERSIELDGIDRQRPPYTARDAARDFRQIAPDAARALSAISYLPVWAFAGMVHTLVQSDCGASRPMCRFRTKGWVSPP